MRRNKSASFWCSRTSLFFLLLTGACETGPAESPEVFVEAVRLRAAESCADLESGIEDALIAEMRRSLEQQREWIRARAMMYPSGGAADMGSFSAADAGSGSSPTTPGGPVDHTTTNTQVAGVDEPDFMKNDGTRILMLRGKTLFTARSWPPEALQLAGQLELDSWPSQMFLAGDRAVIISDTNLSGASCSRYGCWRGATELSVIDVSDLARPRLTHRVTLPGHSVAARRVGPSVRLVLTDYLNWPDGVRLYPEYDYDRRNDTDYLLTRIDELEAANIALIRQRALAEYVPHGWMDRAGSARVELGYRCGDFFLSNAPVELGLTTVATVDLDHMEAVPARASALVAGHQVYATADALYLASPHWSWRARSNQSWTYLHKFDVTDAAHPRYVASGGIPGTLLNQFAMDEHRGYLRVAATERRSALVPPNSGWVPPVIEARVRVLEQVGDRLRVVGTSGPFERGESVTAVRFMGDRGMVVTFERTDPVYTLDLANPRDPHIRGELKVPGFSAYLHPLDATHVVGLGVYQPDPGEGTFDWRERRLKLSVYDVSDFDAPREVQTMLVGSFLGWSAALGDHHGFNYFASKRLLAIPFVDERMDPSGAGYWSGFTSELRLFRFAEDGTFSAIGKMSLQDLYQTSDQPYWSYWYGPYARRSVMATAPDGTDYLYGISDAGLRAAKVASPDVPLATVRFPAASP